MWQRFYSPDNLHILLASSKLADTRTQAWALSVLYSGPFPAADWALLPSGPQYRTWWMNRTHSGLIIARSSFDPGKQRGMTVKLCCSDAIGCSLGTTSSRMPSLITLIQGALTAQQSHFLAHHPALLPGTFTSED